ncbi:MAG TPA: serine protease [Methylophilaceae bacterium]|nr:serine protease [Methylophilaceae bacterium]
MKPSFKFFLFFPILFSLFSTTALALNKDELMNSFLSVVMIRGYNESGGLAFGSGVVVGDNQVVTNCHVIRRTKQPWVSQGEDTFSVTAVKADRWHDLCLLTTFGMPHKAVAIGKSSDLKKGQEVIAIGHSNGVPAPLTSAGVVKSTYDLDQGKVILSSAQFRLGASGSGLFDTEGRLVGINTFKTSGRNSFYYALPVEWLSTLKNKPAETNFPITGIALWEEDEDKKPIFLQVAIPTIKEDWKKLLAVANEWVKKENNNAEAWFELGLANEHLNDLMGAEKAYRQSTKLDNQNTDALLRLGVIAKSKDDKNEIKTLRDQIAKINPELIEDYNQLVGCSKPCE